MALLDYLKTALTKWLMQEHPPEHMPLCDFQRIKVELRPGDVILVEGCSKVSDIIRNITQSPWTHSGLYIGCLHDIDNPILRQRLQDFSSHDADTPLLIESYLGHGTIVVPLTNYEKAHLRICRPRGLSRKDRQQVIGFAIGKLGIDYDVRQILDLARLLLPWGILPRRWRSSLFEMRSGQPMREICSTLLAQAFASIQYPILPLVKKDAKTGMEFINRNPRLCVPCDFDYSPYFDIIKYPMFDLSDEASYRNLPWNRDGLLSNDEHGVMNSTELNKPVKKSNSQQGANDPIDDFGDHEEQFDDDGY